MNIQRSSKDEDKEYPFLFALVLVATNYLCAMLKIKLINVY